MQRIDLFENFVEGMQRIAELIFPVVLPRKYLFFRFRELLNNHINNQIEHFKQLGAPRIKDIEDKWKALLDEKRFDIIFDAFFELYERSKVTGQPEIEKIVEPTKEGNVILLSVVPHRNVKAFLNSLPVSISEINNRYSNFIIEQKREMRLLSNWEKRDLVHIIYFEDTEEILFDVLYNVNIKLELVIFGYLMEKQGFPRKKGNKFEIAWENMYPTCLLSSIEASNMAQFIAKEEVSIIHKS